MYNFYCRLELPVTASDCAVVKAARAKLTGALHPSFRLDRHKFYRVILGHHHDAQRLFNAVQTGDFA